MVGLQPIQDSLCPAARRTGASTCLLAHPTVTYHLPKQRFKLELECADEFRSKRLSSVEVVHRQYFHLKPDRPVGWQKLHRRLTALDHLIALLVGASIHARRIIGIPATSSDDRTIAILWVQRGDPADQLLTPQMIFPLPEIASEFETICNQWFKAWMPLKGMLDVFFGNLRVRPAYLESRLFHLAQCLEAFHRKTARDEKYVSKKKWPAVHSQIAGCIPTKLPEGLRCATIQALAWVNAYSFGDRLRFIFQSLEGETVALITTDSTKFVKAIKDTRNWFTHLERHKKSKPFPRERWLHACNRMEALLIILLLNLCGLSENRIRQRLKKSKHYDREPYSFARHDEMVT